MPEKEHPDFQPDDASEAEAPVKRAEVEYRTDGPVIEDENSISYLGVKLEKGHVPSAFVPDRKSYSGERYIQDPFSLELQQKLAVSFLQDEPILLEGGTSIGKTTTVRKMASELGWEVHYVNLNGASDVEDLMGRYIPNAHRERLDDPEFRFADGKVTSGLRIEEGKKKIIVIDELNSAAPQILIRLHEVLDALERNGTVTLSEDASESVPVNKDQTKVVGLMNPPGKGFIGREPLDPAQLRRWNYQKEVTNLPSETFSHATDVMFGLAAEIDTNGVSQESYLHTREQRLVPEQLKEIPGIQEVLTKYKEFHQGAKQLAQNRNIGADQPQKFTYDDRMEPRRVKEFVQQFYNGDINETFQKALRYYYSNKVEGKADKQKLEELISHVAYTAPVESRRRGIDDTERARNPLQVKANREIEDLLSNPKLPESVKAALSSKETMLSPDVIEQMKEAKSILGQDFIGPDEAKAALGFEASEIPNVPFSKEELERAKELGQILILRQPVTMEQIIDSLKGKLKDGRKLLGSIDEATGKLSSGCWYKDEKFLKEERATAGWALVSKEVVPGSTSKNYLEQTEVMIDYLQNKVFEGKTPPPEFADAVMEFNAFMKANPGFAPKVKSAEASEWKAAAAQLESLKITKLTRQSPVEALYDMAAYAETNGQRLLQDKYTWTKARSSDGYLVDVGRFDSDGADVGGGTPGYSGVGLGVSFSRNL